ncbi:MAG: glycosyltransferase, partial [Pyrinomonadaceae bacterium]
MLVTFALVAYNQERFIAEAIHGALSQTYQPLEIILSDDCSTDHTFEIINQEIAGYSGPHEIRLNRNERNIGFSAHINRVTAMARGQLRVAAAGDDISLPLRVERLHEAYERSDRKALSVFSNATVINEHGLKEGPYLRSLSQKHQNLSWLAEHLSGALGCAQAWDRRVFELFGPMDEDILQEDIVIPFRAALLGEVQFVSEPLVLYRRHSTNIHFKSAHEVIGGASLRSSLLKHADGKIAI